MTTVRLESLSHSYGPSHRTFEDFNLEIGSGEFVVLVGPSGCGKSTLLRLMAGLEKVQKGAVYFGDDDVSSWSPKQRNIAMVFQNYALYPHLSVRSNLELTLKIAGVPREERSRRVEEVADYLEISKHLSKKPAHLSGGQRQRVAMGRALVRSPQVFLFDEPLSNLDAELRTRLRARIKRMHGRYPATKIYVTHDQVEAMTLADRIVVLRDGKIEQIGTPEEIYDSPETVFVGQFFGSPAINLLDPRRWQGAFEDVLPVSMRGRAQGQLATREDAFWAVRPEHVSVTGGSSEGKEPHAAEQGRFCVQGVLVGSEHLGSQRVLELETPLGILRAIVSAHDCSLGLGDAAICSLPIEQILFFRMNDGRRIRETASGRPAGQNHIGASGLPL